MEKSRVQKFIALSGFCSRRKAEKLIGEGKVTVNLKVVKLGDHCNFNDEIRVGGRKIQFNSNEKLYIIMNKFEGFVCSKSDPHNKKTIYDLISKEIKINNLFSVGRLDKDTTGLLILTNDGELSQKIIHPSSKIKKEYIFSLDKNLQEKDKVSIEKGLILEGYKLSSCKIKKLKNEYSITIFEGKKRQIRKIFEMKNYKIIKLKRVKIGNLELKSFNLKLGEYKIVKKYELDKIFT